MFFCDFWEVASKSQPVADLEPLWVQLGSNLGFAWGGLEPTWSLLGPTWGQEAHRTAEEATKTAHESPKTTPTRPKMPQDAPTGDIIIRSQLCSNRSQKCIGSPTAFSPKSSNLHRVVYDALLQSLT